MGCAIRIRHYTKRIIALSEGNRTHLIRHLADGTKHILKGSIRACSRFAGRCGQGRRCRYVYHHKEPG